MTGWMRSDTEESAAGRCAKAYAMSPCPSTWDTIARPSSTSQPPAPAGRKGCGAASAMGSNTAAVMVVLHAMRRAVEAPASRATLIVRK